MKLYQINDDIEIIKELKQLNDQQLAEKIGVNRNTLSRWRKDEEKISKENLEALYAYAFQSGIRLNGIKEQLYREDYSADGHVILFHGAKTAIDGPLSLAHAKKVNDFGPGFYCGENLEQSAMFVANYPESSLYIVDFAKNGLNEKRFKVDRNWMLAIAFFRNRLGEYADAPQVRKIVKSVGEADYIVAPIADNRMFEIIDSFIDGEITDVQCQHCLSATNLGFQYVFTTQKALDAVTILRHCYLANVEKEAYLASRRESSAVGRDKVKVARIRYRGQGRYIEEILK